MKFEDLPAQTQNRVREEIRGSFASDLAQLLGRAASAGLVITVDFRRATPLSKPGMVPEVRHARGHYLKDE